MSQAPTTSKPHQSIYDDAVWLQYNGAVDLLSSETERDYSRFKIVPNRGEYSDFIYVDTYRQKVGGSKGQLVQFIQDDGVWVWLRNNKLRFEYRVKRTHFEKYYEKVKMKKKKKGVKNGSKTRRI